MKISNIKFKITKSKRYAPYVVSIKVNMYTPTEYQYRHLWVLERYIDNLKYILRHENSI